MEKSRVRGKRRHGAVNKMALLAITAGAVAFGAGCGNSVMDRKAALGFALEDAGLTADDITVTRQELEKEQIVRWINKKHFSPETATLQEKQKIMSFLYRKGFSIDNIRSALSLDINSFCV